MNRYSQSDWNVVRDLDKLRELTQCPGGTPSRWVRQMAAEIIRLRKDNESLLGRHSQATTDLLDHVAEVERLRQYEPLKGGVPVREFFLQQENEGLKGTVEEWKDGMECAMQENKQFRALISRIETLAAGNVTGCGTCTTIIDAIRAGEPRS